MGFKFILELNLKKAPSSGGSDSKESACNSVDQGSIPGSGRSPGEGNGYPLQYPLAREFHGQWSLVGYSSWRCKDWTCLCG